MKTLSKPSTKLDAKISLNKLYRQNTLDSYSFQYKNFYLKWKFLLVAMSFFTFLIISDSPEIDSEICNRFHSEQACNIW